MLEFCKKHNIHVTAYAPLGSGDRPAGLKKEDEPVLLQEETIAKSSAKLGHARWISRREKHKS
jgi:alcohol dehydrogenase (NADP+)